jgi:hypothetical protein
MKAVKYILFSVFAFIISSTYAQDGDKFPKIEEMHNQKWQFLITQAQLSPDEIKKVEPVFMNYEKAVWDLHTQNREFFKSTMVDAKKNAAKYAELNDRYVDFEFKQAQLFKSYHAQLRKLLEPETLFKYYKAEREFKRKLLQDFKDRRPMDKSKQH